MRRLNVARTILYILTVIALVLWIGRTTSCNMKTDVSELQSEVTELQAVVIKMSEDQKIFLDIIKDLADRTDFVETSMETNGLAIKALTLELKEIHDFEDIYWGKEKDYAKLDSINCGEYPVIPDSIKWINHYPLNH